MNEYQCPNCFGTTFYWFDDSSGIECKTCARFIPDEELEKIAINKDAPQQGRQKMTMLDVALAVVVLGALAWCAGCLMWRDE